MRRLLVCGVLLMLGGCASSTQVRQPLAGAPPGGGPARYAIADVRSEGNQAPEPFLMMLRTHLENELRAHGMLVPSGSQARDLHVAVTAYRMRGEISRAVWGAFAGKDGVTSLVRITAPGSAASLGESSVSSYNVTVMSGPDSIAKMHAQEIARFLAGTASP